MAKGELDALRSMLGGTKLDPLQQTVFEKGPEVGFVPPAAPILRPQEGRVVFSEPIVSVDPGIDWAALGQQAFKIGGDLFEKTLDYLIDSKANGLADLSDMYRSKLDDAYVKLSQTSKQSGSFNDDVKYAKSGKMSWKDVKVRPSESDSQVTDGVLDEIKKIKEEWREKANTILENGEGNFYTPAIDYWDENLPLNMNQIGSKYQQLAVSARKADRQIMDQAEKLLFESQFASTASGKKATDAIPNKFINGLFPVATAELPLPSRLDGTKAFHDIDPQTGQETIQTVDGNPILVVDEMGSVRFNSTIPPKAIWRAMNDEDFKLYVDLEQRQTEYSALYSEDGRLTPMVEELANEYFDAPEATRDPRDLWKLGVIFAQMPPSSIAGFAKSKDITQTEAEYLNFAVDSARIGQTSTALSKWRAITPNQITNAVRVFDTFANPELGTPQGTRVGGATVNQLDALTNKVVVPVIAQLAGLTEEEQQNYKVNVTGDGRAIDTTPNETLATFMVRNPALRTAAVKAIAYFQSNPSLMYDEKGTLRSDEEIKKSIAGFITTETNRAGLVTLRDKRTGQPMTIYNPKASWIGLEYSKDTDNLARASLSYPLAGINTYRAGENMREIDYSLGRSVFGSGVDRDTFAAIHSNLAYSVRGNDNFNYGTEGLPQAEVLRLAAASHPVVWTKYVKPGIDIKNLTQQEKIDLALTAYKDILPATEWGITTDFSMRYEGFMSMEKGGLPFGFTTIPTQNGKDLFDLVPSRAIQFSAGNVFTPENKDNSPALFIKYDAANPFFMERLSTNYGYATQNVPAYQVINKQDAPAFKRQAISTVLQQVAQVTPIKNFDYTFAYVKDQELTTPEDLYKFINLNRETVKSVVKNDKDVDMGVLTILDDFGKPSKDRFVFTDANLKLMFEDAKTKGVRTSLDFVSYAVNVANAAAKNKETKSSRNSVFNVVEEFKAKNIEINFDDNSFFVPSTGKDSSYDGYVLYNPNSKEFFDGIKKYSMEGYNVYVDNNPTGSGGTQYFLLKPEEKAEDYLTLVLPAKTPSETAEQYAIKYNQVFGQREQDITTANQISEKVKAALFAQEQPTDAPQFKKQTVLPSYMQSTFNTELNNFMVRNKVNFSNMENLTDVLDVALFYDLPKLYYETGSLPQSLKDLPIKYRLPGHSSFVNAQNRRPQSKPAKTMQNRLSREDYWTRATKLKEALESGNIYQAIDALAEEPVAKLRSMDNGLTQNFNQDALNILLLAFEPNSDNYYKPEFESQYGVTKASFDKAMAFAKAGWTPAAFEHQVRTVAKGLKQAVPEPTLTEPKDIWTVNEPKKQEQAILNETFNGIVADLNPASFLLDEQVAADLIGDLKIAMPKDSKISASDLVEYLIKNPNEAVDLKKEYLMVSLLPQARDKERSRRSLKAIGIAKRIWAYYKNN